MTLSDLNINNYSTSGIAGVTYVNRMVGIAGGAAQEAESHASVAGTYAVSAYNSAKAANEALSDKQDTLVPDKNIKGSGSVTVTKDGNVITVSGTDTTYTAGETVTITGDNNAINVVTADGDTLGVVKQGTNTTIANGAVNVANANRNDTDAAPGVVKYSNVNMFDLLNPESDKLNGTDPYGENEVLNPEAVHYATAMLYSAMDEVFSPMIGERDGVVVTDADGNLKAAAPGKGLQVVNGVPSVKIDETGPLNFVGNGVLDVNVGEGLEVKNGTLTLKESGAYVKEDQTDASDPSVSQFNIMMTDGDSKVVRASLVATDSDGNKYNQINYYGPNKAQIVKADAKKAGVMKWGEVPAGSPTSTTSAQIWIE